MKRETGRWETLDRVVEMIFDKVFSPTTVLAVAGYILMVAIAKSSIDQVPLYICRGGLNMMPEPILLPRLVGVALVVILAVIAADWISGFIKIVKSKMRSAK